MISRLSEARRTHRAFAIFTLVRLLGVAIRPFLLFVLIQSGRSEAANGFALLISCVASSFILLNNQNFREVYQRFLSPKNPNGEPRSIAGRDAIYAYLDGVAIHSFLIMPVLVGVIWLWTNDPQIIFCTIILCLTERYFDDDQRYELFRHRYLGWSINFTFRVILPSLTVLACTSAGSTPAAVIYTFISLAGAIIYIFSFRRRFLRLVKVWITSPNNVFPGQIRKKITNYFVQFRNEYAWSQAWSFLSANLLILDRFVVSRAFPDKLAEYVLIVNVASTITLFHNLIFFTKVRPKLIDAQLDGIKLMFSLGNWLAPVGLWFLIITTFIGAKLIGLYHGEGNYFLVGLVCAVYMVDALNLITADLAFWRLRRSFLVYVSLGSFAVFYIFYQAQKGPLWAIPLGLLLALGLRNATIFVASISDNKRFRLMK